MKKQLYRAAAATVLGLSLTTGMVAADNSGSLNHTGPGSDNHVSSSSASKTRVWNHNHLGVNNINAQSAYTGDATTRWNTTGGSATTGDASNHNTVTAAATIDNSSSMPTNGGSSGGSGATGSISYTGPGSDNSVSSHQYSSVSVANDNDIYVNNANFQRASSGDASVQGNTTGGSATSGSASNTSSSSFTFNVTN